MAISIKDHEADRLARKVAAMTGKTITEAVTDSLREVATRLEKEKDREAILAEIKAIGTSVRESLIAEGKLFHSSDHADIYDEYGAPK
jgi:antitoxin VapB